MIDGSGTTAIIERFNEIGNLFSGIFTGDVDSITDFVALMDRALKNSELGNIIEPAREDIQTLILTFIEFIDDLTNIDQTNSNRRRRDTDENLATLPLNFINQNEIMVVIENFQKLYETISEDILANIS